ncbi:hypothetical protein HY989_03120 [Candidatus Micrarchaeota archaeon]|nr:hypothetical protein [Candidatus Micrarchaeota archaeon]
MKNVILLLFLSFILFGCVQQQPPGVSNSATPQGTVQQQTSSTPTPGAGSNCVAPDVSFGSVEFEKSVVYGSSMAIQAQVLFRENPCAKGVASATVGLYDGKRLLKEVSIASLSSQNPARFTIVPDETRVYSLVLKIASDVEVDAPEKSNNEYKLSFTAEPYGYFADLSGNDVFEVNSLNYRAQAFKIDSPMPVKNVEVYLRRAFDAYQSSEALVYIRPDANGKPSGTNSIQYSTSISTLPTTFGWVKFESTSKTTLQPGIYWLVVKTLSPNPSMDVLANSAKVFQDAKYSMKTESAAPFETNWQVHKEGTMYFRFTNPPVEIIDQNDYSGNATPRPSTEFDPYSAV